MAKFGKNKLEIYGLQSPRDDWFIEQLDAVVDAGEHIDGTTIEFKGVGQLGMPVVEIHGKLNPLQMQMLSRIILNPPVEDDRSA